MDCDGEPVALAHADDPCCAGWPCSTPSLNNADRKGGHILRRRGRRRLRRRPRRDLQRRRQAAHRAVGLGGQSRCTDEAVEVLERLAGDLDGDGPLRRGLLDAARSARGRSAPCTGSRMLLRAGRHPRPRRGPARDPVAGLLSLRSCPRPALVPCPRDRRQAPCERDPLARAAPPDAARFAEGPVRLIDTASSGLVDATTGPAGRLYVCGITPYDATHMGHAATYVAFDLLHRAWRDAGLRTSTTCRTSPTSTTRCSSAPPRRARTGASWPRERPSCSATTWRRCGCCRPTTTSAPSRRSR